VCSKPLVLRITIVVVVGVLVMLSFHVVCHIPFYLSHSSRRVNDNFVVRSIKSEHQKKEGLTVMFLMLQVSMMFLKCYRSQGAKFNHAWGMSNCFTYTNRVQYGHVNSLGRCISLN